MDEATLNFEDESFSSDEDNRNKRVGKFSPNKVVKALRRSPSKQ